MIDFISKLTSVAPRYGVDEMLAAKIIIEELSKLGVNCIEEKFQSSVPRILEASLFVDGLKVPCLGSSFTTGDIKSNDYIIDSLNDPEAHLPYSIGYSSVTDNISVVSFFDEPAVTVSRTEIPKIKSAKSVLGHVEVVEEKYTTENILVGNSHNPTNIIIAHFDCVTGQGAMDNAAAIAVVLEVIKTRPSVLNDCLFVFSGNEEISYERNPYSGHGYRVFESKHQPQLNNAKNIIVVDGVGISTPNFTQDQLDIVLQFRSLPALRSKVFWLQNDQSLVLQDYHSTNDTIDKLSSQYLDEAVVLLASRL